MARPRRIAADAGVIGAVMPRQVNGGGAIADIRRALYANAPYVLLVGIYVLSGIAILGSMGRELPYDFAEGYGSPAVLTVTYLLLTGFIAMVSDVFIARNRPGDPETWRRLWRRWFGIRRLVGTLIVLATLPALLNVMIGFRLSLVDFQPFRYDELFMQLDRTLHFGHHPWEWLQLLLGHPAITVFVDRAYTYGWFSLLWIGVIWQAVHGREPVRLQFFLSFSASWILLGTIAAIALSSAGPVFYERVTGLADPYDPLMAYLYSVDARTPLDAVANQERLWLTYRTWGGITAMPSMHLAISTVVVLAAVRTHRVLGYVVIPVWLLMLLGSVHLGWHYAIDSYAGIFAAGILWVACGRVARWWIGRQRALDESPKPSDVGRKAAS